MQKINSEASLREAILQLEKKRAAEGIILKEQFLLAYDSVKPINLIMSTFNEIVASRDLKNNLINTSVGLTAGYLTKLLFERGTKNPVKKLMGNALMMSIVNIIIKNPDTVKSLGKGFLKIFRSKPRGRVHAS